MRIPEFTAEASLYRANNSYRSLGQPSELQHGVVPQLMISDILDAIFGRGGGGGGAAGGAAGAAVGGALGGPAGAGLGAVLGAEVGRHIHCLIRSGRFCD